MAAQNPTQHKLLEALEQHRGTKLTTNQLSKLVAHPVGATMAELDALWRSGDIARYPAAGRVYWRAREGR